MSIIYEPKGKAREYADLAANLYRGCGHRCRYCYAPQVLRMDREEFYRLPQPRKNVLEELKKACQKYRGDERPVLLCFTSDPYQPIELESKITREALAMMFYYSLRPTILTMAGSWSFARDKDLLQDTNAIWATTLTCISPTDSEAWEPGAAMPLDRWVTLADAKEAGLETWVSFEPVLSPVAVLSLIDITHDVVDHYKIGTLNYHPRAREIDWHRFRGEVEEKLQKLGKSYYLKKDLLEATA